MQPYMSQAVVLKQANVLQLADANFHNLISELEQDLVFKQLFNEKLIRFRRFPRTDIHPSFLLTDDSIPSGQSFIDIEELIEQQPETLAIIRKIGDERFRKYFLFPEDSYSPGEIGTDCDISPGEIDAVNILVNKLSVLSTFYHPPDSSPQLLTNTCLASIDNDRDGFIIRYCSPSYARGRYVIDYGQFEEFIVSGNLEKQTVTEARALLGKLEMINRRKDIIQDILLSLISRQSAYLKSGSEENLLPLTQKELATQIGAVPSSVSRAVRRKSIITPWEEEIPLKNLLPNPHFFKKKSVREALDSEPFLKSDEAIRNRILKKTGLDISRRSISEFRKELNIPAKGSRRKDKVTG